MAINPLQPPMNYAGMVPQINIGQQFAELGQALAERQQRTQAQEGKAAYAADLQNAITNPTQETWSQMIAKYPKQREAFTEARRGYGEVAATNEFNQGFEVSMALENGRPDIAQERLLTIITARKSANLPTGIYQQTFDELERGNTKGAQAGVNYALSMADPDRFKKQVEARTTAEKAPSALKQAIAEAEIKVEDLRIKLRDEPIEQERLVIKRNLELAQAKEAKVKARYADPLAQATLEKLNKEKLAPSVQEAIDFANLSEDQRKTFQNLQILKRPPGAVTNVNVTNLDKTAAGELGKLVPDLYSQANSAASQIGDLPRYMAALDSAITGPFAPQRLSTARVASALGFTGDKAVNATREVIQGLSEMALKSRTMLTGQGQITEGEQKLLVQARSGDINFTKGELKTIFAVADRAAKAQYSQSKKLLESAAKQSPTAQMFLDNLQPLPTEAPAPASVTVNGKTYTRPANFTDAQWNEYKRSEGIP
jgi:hypothetical protein